MLSYCGIKDAARNVWQCGLNIVVAKVDIKSDYRVVPVQPEDQWLLGMCWEESRMWTQHVGVCGHSVCGLSSAPKLFTARQTVELIAKEAGVQCVMHYLDDFLVIESPGTDKVERSVKILMQVFETLGFPIAWRKLEGPGVRLTFLDIGIDSQAMEVCLPEEKLREMKALVLTWLENKACKRKELESSLVG